jgi:hypothetical protein
MVRSTDGRQSEMNETFCFFSFAAWRQAVEQAGFRVHPSSRAYTNPWLIENRYAGKVQLFASNDERSPALAADQHGPRRQTAFVVKRHVS